MSYLLCSHKFHKIVHYFSFEVLKKKIWSNFQRIIELFTQKIVTKLSKVWVWDTGSRIQGSQRHRIPDPGSGSATLGASHHCGSPGLKPKYLRPQIEWVRSTSIGSACQCHWFKPSLTVHHVFSCDNFVCLHLVCLVATLFKGEKEANFLQSLFISVAFTSRNNPHCPFLNFFVRT